MKLVVKIYRLINHAYAHILSVHSSRCTAVFIGKQENCTYSFRRTKIFEINLAIFVFIC